MTSMRLYLGSDHAGFELKAKLLRHLLDTGHDPVDCGALELDALDDYPPPCIAVAHRTVATPGSLGIVIGGSGNGEQIAANKVTGVRAALVWSEVTARLSREHNNANVISIGARNHAEDEAIRFIDLFLATPFSQDERHQRRIAMLAEYEETGAIADHDTAWDPVSNGRHDIKER
jgi:ribose 5-phosphate isomerase B